jgi:ribonuclease P protein component
VASPAGADFPRRYRIVRGAEYRALYAQGRKLHSESFVLFARENALEHHRIGLTVSRRVGGAVIRNRVKRLLREVFRRSRREIPHHYDFVVNARRESRDRDYQALRREFLDVAGRLSRPAGRASAENQKVE